MSIEVCFPSQPCFLFAGPTLRTPGGRSVLLPEDVTLRPPVARGDIDALLREADGNAGNIVGTIILADGVFHQSLAVAHAELREAIHAGWSVWGLSSMGAIRAREMHTLGMIGYGQVYEKFLAEEDFQDDEVALLHEADPPYRCFSEPLVHMRAALEAWQAAGWMLPALCTEVADTMKSLWYGDRTMERFQQTIGEVLERSRNLSALQNREQLELSFADFDRYRLKTSDLASFLERGLWR
jgi:hypothetical protein